MPGGCLRAPFGYAPAFLVKHSLTLGLELLDGRELPLVAEAIAAKEQDALVHIQIAREAVQDDGHLRRFDELLQRVGRLVGQQCLDDLSLSDASGHDDAPLVLEPLEPVRGGLVYGGKETCGKRNR